MSFKDLKKNTNTVADLSKQLEKMNASSFTKDERLWSPERDKTGNGFAVIRFLPACEGEEIPWARVFSHSFKGPSGKWYIQNCPTTIGGKCYCCVQNGALWSSGSESDKEIARSRKRKLRYISNVYVIKDPAHPENEGKVKLFNYGKKIFDKITESMNPQYEGEVAINPFDFWTGRDFKIKICTIGDFPNYDKSEFSPASPFLGGDDKKLEALWHTQYPLLPFTAVSEFKSFEELQQIYNDVLENNGGTRTTSIAEESRNLSTPRQTEKAPFAARPATTNPMFTPNTSGGGSPPPGNPDAELDYLKSLVGDEE